MESNVTTCLFHYTDSIDKLKNILSIGLYPNYCKETYSYNSKNQTVGIPMISFCDIPLKRIDTFSSRYGKYAIGLSKEWGANNAINPVFYALNEDITAGLSFFRNFQFDMKEKLKQYGCDGTSFPIPWPLKDGPINGLSEFINYGTFKNHNCLLWGLTKSYYSTHKGELQCNYIENEWRYIIKENKSIEWLWGNEDYQKWRGSAEKPPPSVELKKQKLYFGVSDIFHIVIHKENERQNIIDWIKDLNSIGGNLSSSINKDLLISRINSFEQVEADF